MTTMVVQVSLRNAAGHRIEDEGTALHDRRSLNFVGDGVEVTDDSGNDATVVTIDVGGAVDSVDGQTGVVDLSSVYDAAGTAASAVTTEATARATADGLLVPKTTQVAGHALSANVTLVKGDVGLGNVDNTTDASKPVSTAQAVALAAKTTVLLWDSGTHWPTRPSTGSAPVVLWVGPVTAGTPSDMAANDGWFQTRDQTPPAQVAGLAGTVGDRQVALTWTANSESDLSYYRVYLDSVLYGTTFVTNSATVTGLTNGHAYTITVSAVDTSDNEGTQSASVSKTPADTVNPNAPTALSPYAVAGNAEAVVYWTPSTSADVDHHEIRYQQDSGGFGAWASATSPVNVAGLVNGSVYDFQIRAVDDDGNVSSSLSGSGYSGVTPSSTANALLSWIAALTGVVGYWYADDITGISDGAVLATWPDSSGNAHDATTAASNKPLYRASVAAYNNHPAVDFVNGNSKLVASFTAQSQPWSIFVVGNFGAASGTAETMTDGGTSISADRMCIVHSSTGTVQFRTATTGSAIVGPSEDTSPHAFAAVANGASSSFDVGTSHATGSPASATPTGLTIGSQWTTGTASSVQLTGKVAFVLVKAGAATPTEIANFLSAVTSRYGI